MMRRRVRFAIVIAHQRCDDGPVAPFEPPDIAIEGEIFPVLVMPAMPHHVTDVMQQCAGFQQHPRLRGKMMRRLQLIEKENAQLAHMLGMLLIVSEPPCKTSCPNNELPCLGIVAMGLLARKCIPRNSLQQSFANADPGYRKRAQIQVS